MPLQPMAQHHTAALHHLNCCPCCWLQGWLTSLDAPIKFIFDGDQVDPDETPEGLDLEGEEMIEVRF